MASALSQGMLVTMGGVSRVIEAKVDMPEILPSACWLVVWSWAIHVASGSPLTETAQAAS